MYLLLNTHAHPQTRFVCQIDVDEKVPIAQRRNWAHFAALGELFPTSYVGYLYEVGDRRYKCGASLGFGVTSPQNRFLDSRASRLRAGSCQGCLSMQLDELFPMVPIMEL